LIQERSTIIATGDTETKLPRLLIIKDDPSQVSTLCERFESSGYDVLVAKDGSDGQSICSTYAPDAIIVDLTLPDVDGVQVVRNLRRKAVSVPVVILSERGAVEQRVSGLAEGADDYVVKPFEFPELLERIVTLLRRQSYAEVTVLRFEDIVINLLTRTVTIDGNVIRLRTRQFAVLTYLIRHQGEIVSREELAREIWHDESVTWKNVIEVQINRLRSIFSEIGRPLHLQTIRGKGYVIGDLSPNSI
jgi:two-component system copper resistance phosphate regulon response regulator CusR